MGQWLETLPWLAANPQWLGLALVIVACMECLAVVGLIVPGTVMVFAIAVLAGNGVLTLGETLAVASSAGCSAICCPTPWAAVITRASAACAACATIRVAATCRALLPAPALPACWSVASSARCGRCAADDRRHARHAVRAFLLVSLRRRRLVDGLFAARLSAGAAMRLPLEEGERGGGGRRRVADADRHHCLGSLASCAGSRTGDRPEHRDPARTAWPHLGSSTKAACGDPGRTQHHTRSGHGADHTRGRLPDPALGRRIAVRAAPGPSQWRAAIFSILTLLGTAMANGALKASFARVRPEVLMEPLSSYSFPSGHSSAAFAFFSPWAYSPAAISRRACAWLLAGQPAGHGDSAFAGLPGVHWMTDVTAGALLAASICALSLTLVQWRALAALPAKVGG